MVRYFCAIDESPQGRISLTYADAFMAMGLSVRLIPAKYSDLHAVQAGTSEWGRHRGSFLTPIVGPYVNVVCGDHDDWRRLYTVSVKNVLIAGEPPGDMDIAMGLAVPMTLRQPPDTTDNSVLRVEVYRPPPEPAIRVALQYQVIVVPTQEIAERWRRLGGNAVVVPTSVARHALELRLALFS